MALDIWFVQDQVLADYLHREAWPRCAIARVNCITPRGLNMVSGACMEELYAVLELLI